ncbi:MAG: helix-turn-helix domain-containing protein [Oscillospiraceae bacterium]|nr:helix-turn-helix domain-containing protein [Oscillospiraceae bacterium]
MKDKITFGKFIRSKRKEQGLSQKALADKLYVTESAVSKWERGLSYPDITMISGICEVLNITEHELCTASVDEKQHRIELMAEKYKRFVIIYNIILCIGYLSAIIPCFIAFVIKEHSPSKFFILLTSLMMTASVLNVPVIAYKNKWLITFGSLYVSLNLLFLSGSVYSGGDWFLMAFIAVSMGLCILLLPFILRSDLLSPYIGKNKSLICMIADTVMIMATIAYGTYKYGSSESFYSGILCGAFCLAIVWAIFVIVRYAKFNVFFKIASGLSFVSVWLLSFDFVMNKIFKTDNITIITDDYNSLKIVVAVLAGLSVLFALAGLLIKYHKKT